MRENIKPLCNEEDVLVFMEPTGKRQYLYVYNTEDVVYDDRTHWTGASATATATLGTSVQMTDLEPQNLTAPEVEIYQLRVGVDGGGLVYVEMMAGTHRRGTWKAPRPTSSNYYIGHLNDTQSPAEDPRFEMFLKYNQYPAFAVYNPWVLRTIETRLHLIGKKLRCYDMENSATPAKIGVDERVVQDILNRVKAGTWAHRAITPRGLEM